MPDKKLKLLIADDHRIFMEGLQHLLVHELQVEIKGLACNGKEAIEKCGQTDTDVIIMDINMPVVDGIQATSTIKQLYPYIKVIIISSADDMNTIAHALKAGADAYVLKDEGIEDLIKAFRAISKNEIYISSAVAHLFLNEKNGIKTKTELVQFAESLITPREQSILKLITEGYTNQEIANTLFIAVATADTHRKNMLSKLKLPNTASLVKFAVENKLV
ncbi:MAG: response regulator transcription factor [Panacibacter sp.]